MNTKLQELTDKIYQEGVERGEQEANNIIAEARAKEKSILDEAEQEAKRIIDEANKKAEALQKNTESELKLFTRQMVDALKIEITDLISGKITADSVKAATANADFMKEVILSLVKEWAGKKDLVIGTAKEKELTEYFEKNAKTLLNEGVKIEKVNNIKTNFQITSKAEGYKIEFGDEEFMAYFKEFLRPKLIEILF